MDWNKLLTPEAIATYVVFALGVLFGAAGFFISRWISRKRPRKVLLVKVGESSLIRVAPNVKDEIIIKYRDKFVESLYLTSFTIWNNSDDVIENIKVQIEFEDTDVIDVDVVDNMPDRASSATQKSNNNLDIQLPFLNPRKLYKDAIRVNVIALKPIKVKSVLGGGREWAVEFFDQEEFFHEVFDESVAGLSSPASLIRATTKLLTGWSKVFKLFP